MLTKKAFAIARSIKIAACRTGARAIDFTLAKIAKIDIFDLVKNIVGGYLYIVFDLWKCGIVGKCYVALCSGMLFLNLYFGLIQAIKYPSVFIWLFRDPRVVWGAADNAFFISVSLLFVVMIMVMWFLLSTKCPHCSWRSASNRLLSRKVLNFVGYRGSTARYRCKISRLCANCDRPYENEEVWDG